MRIHFVGIGGEGMVGVAKLAISRGHTVSGSDTAAKQSINELRSLGAIVFNSHASSHIDSVELVVRSSGIPFDHLEVKAALGAGIQVIKRSECLGKLLREGHQKVIRIAGAYGKSSTTAMVGQILRSANLDPTIIIGAYSPQLSSHAVIGQGPYAVVESCEFDSSFLDIPGFMSVITGIEPDHLDYYQGGLEQIIETFLEFAHQSGKVIACIDNANVRNLFLPRCVVPVETYGFSSSDWAARIIDSSRTAHNDFQVLNNDVLKGTFEISLPGIHYVQNALAAVAVGYSLNIDKDSIKDGLRSYRGLSRRYEKIVNLPGVVVIDDYGHTPLEIEAVIKAVREEFPSGFLVCVPCLRQFHRTLRLLGDFASVLSKADMCVTTPIVRGLGDTKETVDTVSPGLLSKAIIRLGGVSQASYGTKEAVKKIRTVIEDSREGRIIVLTIGSGISSEILALLGKEING
jgi:UDP-N-acetylmuramate--alanine ligase